MDNNVKVKLNFDEYKDRVYACWTGKNIGGTMGAPYECSRTTQDISGFATAAGKPLPNDDLDLQLIWLHAVEQMGPLSINAAALGEYWISLLPPNWNEYGIGKNNMKRGLIPPLSGDYQNSWKHSNGAWIRTEIWACMAPGCPALAAKYAMEDGKVDHGAGEGTVAAAFVAAMQSAAFVVRDVRTCLEIGLSVIPENSRMADSVRFIFDCYKQGMTAMDARNAIFERNADIGDGWFEAPSNVSYSVIGLLWGNGDFKKSMITTINCGDDADCTAATVGATLGILGGSAAIPADWKAHIGDDIITISINKGDFITGGSVPKTCMELTERTAKQAPFMLFANHAEVGFTNGKEELGADIKDRLFAQCADLKSNTIFQPFTARFESALLCADLILDGAPDIEPNEEKVITLRVNARRALGDELINLNCRWWLPEGFELVKGKQTAIITNQNSHDSGVATFSFTVRAGESVLPVNRLVAEIMPVGRCTPLYVPVVYLG